MFVKMFYLQLDERIINTVSMLVYNVDLIV